MYDIETTKRPRSPWVTNFIVFVGIVIAVVVAEQLFDVLHAFADILAMWGS